MFGLKQAVILALVGATIASPAGWENHRSGGHNRGDDQSPEGRGPGSFGYTTGDVKYVMVTKTMTFDDDGSAPTATPTAGDGDDNVTVTSTIPGNTAVNTAAGTKGKSSPTASGSTPVASNSGDPSYMSTVNEWRVKVVGGDSSKAFTYSSTLEANALKTAADGHGQMVHQLLPGTMGQVLAPGSTSDFLHVFVGGWLCERPSLPGLSTICQTESKGWTYGGQTGHADILSSTKYTKIGCANSGGIWGCDVA